MKFSTTFLRLLSLLAALASFAWTGLGEEKQAGAPDPTEASSAPQPDNAAVAAPADKDSTSQQAPSEKPAKKKKAKRTHNRTSEPIPFGNLSIGEDEHVSEAVAIFGNLSVNGEVDSGAVAVFGNAWINEKAKVDDDAVAVFGNLSIDGEVKGDAVAVFGNIYLGPEAKVSGEVQPVFGRVIHTDGGSGDISKSFTFSHTFADDNPVGSYVQQCILKGRLLWFGPHLGWAWVVAFVHLFLYALLALLLRKPTERCVRTFEERPAMSIFTAFLCFLIVPLLVILLAITGVGLVVVPILAITLIALSVFSRAVMHAWIGRSITHFFGDGPLSHVAISVLFGGLIVTVLYCIPVVAFIVHPILGSIGLGVVVYTIALSMQKEKKTPQPPAGPAPAAPAPIPPTQPLPATPLAPLRDAAPSAAPLGAVADASVSAAASLGAAGFAVPPAEPLSASGAAPVPPPPIIPPSVPPATPQPHTGLSPETAPGGVIAARPPCSSLPRASFWTRMKALAIDALVGSLVIWGWNGIAPKFASISYMPGIVFLLALYGALIWKYRSTSIGGIIFKLQVVRTDDRPLDWSTCVVRALGCILSAFAAGLGFIWIAIDPNREAWHDKIAGTAVVHSPDNQRLV